MYESLQQSLTRIKENLAWIALFKAEQQQGGKISWSSLEHAEKELDTEVGVFQTRFQKMKILVVKQSGTSRKRWERDLEKIQIAFQRLIIRTNGSEVGSKHF